MPQRTYAVIGLGAIGLGMAQSLLRAGLNVIGCNRGPGPLNVFAGNGGRTTHDPAEAAKAADVLFLAVVNAAQAEDVLFGRGQAARALKPGSLVIDCVTVKPAFAREMERRLAEPLPASLPRRCTTEATTLSPVSALAKASGRPEAMMLSCPAADWAGPPETGASR